MTMDMDTDGGHEADFSQATETFLNWFKSLPGATLHEDIKIEDFRGKNAGRGIVATKPIEPETVLFTIPRQSIISTSTSDLPTLLPEVFRQPDPSEDDSDSDSEDNKCGPSYPPKQDPWTSLILILLHEHFRGASSKWLPYLSILPTEFDTPMFWDPSEISHLQASALVSKIGKDQADAMIRSKILSVIRANPSIFFPNSSSSSSSPPPSDEEIISLSHKMGSTIMAYAFDLEKDTPEDDKVDDEEQEQDAEDSWIEDREALGGGKPQQMGMVPMADMLNADTEFNAFINHDSPEALTAVAIRRIEPGEEILNYYGPLASSELLRRYGYVTKKHARYDVVELSWELVAKHLKQNLASLGVNDKLWQVVHKRIAEDQEFDMEEAFVLERQSEDPDSEGRVHGEAVFNSLPEELSEQVKYVLKIAKKLAGPDGEKLSDKDVRNEIYLDSVLKALRERQGQYETSVEEDEKILEEVNGGQSRRALMAIWVRMGEKKLLREAEKWVGDKLAEVKSKTASTTTTSTKRSAGGDEPSAKRRRG